MKLKESGSSIDTLSWLETMQAINSKAYVLNLIKSILYFVYGDKLFLSCSIIYKSVFSINYSTIYFITVIFELNQNKIFEVITFIIYIDEKLATPWLTFLRFGRHLWASKASNRLLKDTFARAWFLDTQSGMAQLFFWQKCIVVCLLILVNNKHSDFAWIHGYFQKTG